LSCVEQPFTPTTNLFSDSDDDDDNDDDGDGGDDGGTGSFDVPSLFGP
jgi:hypothetical protein